jgi:Uma2 family endonuclease
MPVALIATPESPAPLIPPRKRWTRDECALLESSGMWEQQKLELINGELISKMGQNPPHVILLSRMMEWLIRTMGPGRVNVNAPIDVAPEDNPTNEPEPDVIVRKQPPSILQSNNSQPRELDLVVEVSDSSLRFDMTVKARLYARAGIVEYWVLDVSGRRLIVHREPSPAGYQAVVAYNESEKVAPLASPQHELEIGKLFVP